jgi:hypothetical protein
MLYAMKELNPAVSPNNCQMIKINPVTGVITTLATAPLYINREFYSACIDPCNNKYFLSSLARGATGWDTAVLYQFNMSGAVLQHDYTPYFYQGMDVKY